VWLEFDENDAIIESGFRLAQDRHDACALPALFDQIGAMFGVTPRP
jgi:hypothetical protein